ncbi:hypothetical protein RCL1_002161 [Eukaryota sp. TZLM3-RCL]
MNLGLRFSCLLIHVVLLLSLFDKRATIVANSLPPSPSPELLSSKNLLLGFVLRANIFFVVAEFILTLFGFSHRFPSVSFTSIICHTSAVSVLVLFYSLLRLSTISFTFWVFSFIPFFMEVIFLCIHIFKLRIDKRSKL